MLALSVMAVVFVQVQSIRPGSSSELTAGRHLKGKPHGRSLERVTVTESFWKQKEWNAINPASEKSKFGRRIPGGETKRTGGAAGLR